MLSPVIKCPSRQITNIDKMLDEHWDNVINFDPVPAKSCDVLGEVVTQKTQNICIAFVQRRPNVFDVGPALYKCMFCVCWDICLMAIPKK